MLAALLRFCRRLLSDDTAKGKLPRFDHLSWSQKTFLPWAVWHVVRHHNRNLFPRLVPMRSIGVMGDARTYDPSVFLEPGPNYRYSAEELGRISTDLVNKVPGIGRVLLDITSLAGQPAR